MNKKVIIGVIIALIVIIGVAIFFLVNNVKNDENSDSVLNNMGNNLANNTENTETDTDTGNENTNLSGESKSLVLYFSATGNTKVVAEYIQEIIDSDIIEIIPQQEYTAEDLNYSNDNCRANVEQNDDSARPEISNTMNMEEYDVIYLGYPIWWGDVPKIILTLLDSYNLDGKTVIPFCTSGGSGISQSINTLKEYNENINWVEGRRFSNTSTKEDVQSWINELNIY